MAKRKQHRRGLEDLLQRYAVTRNLDIKSFNDGSQLRVHDSGYIAVDVWLTAKYHIQQADYHLLTSVRPYRSRSGERGVLPEGKIEVGRFLDQIFFYADVLEERRLADGKD